MSDGQGAAAAGGPTAGSRWDDDVALALRLADVADGISLERFLAADLHVDAKPDLTPVSDADLAVETALREVLGRERPDDSVLGEEYGETLPGARRRWVIDPIDGTKNFVRGVPVWATLIALLDGDDVVASAVSAPALHRRWWAAAGGGAFTAVAGGAPRRLQVSGVRELGDASLGFSDLAEWDAAGRGSGFRALLERCWRSRGYGDFWPYLLVAEGAVDVAAEPELSLWDVAALVPVVREAGGRITGVDGEPADAGVRSAVASNGLLHDAVLGMIAPDTGREVTGR